ncbi:MAG: hypothetical protein O2923_09890 [Verrucomicrobia bacterium]|nr:hypothetical protein [Verrucomicrobiota bacterium]MDA1087407.1 hypothetical protein [Verrucomicrobiota bacterium]
MNESGLDLFGFVLLLVSIFLGLVIIALPVRWAAGVVGARHRGYGRCLLALIVTTFLAALGMQIQIAGPLVALLLSAAGYAGVLGTSYPRGIAIAVLHFIFAFLIFFAVATIFGIGIVGLGVAPA